MWFLVEWLSLRHYILCGWKEILEFSIVRIDYNVLIREIEKIVISKACTWSAKRNSSNWETCRYWGLSENFGCLD